MMEPLFAPMLKINFQKTSWDVIEFHYSSSPGFIGLIYFWSSNGKRSRGLRRSPDKYIRNPEEGSSRKINPLNSKKLFEGFLTNSWCFNKFEEKFWSIIWLPQPLISVTLIFTQCPCKLWSIEAQTDRNTERKRERERESERKNDRKKNGEIEKERHKQIWRERMKERDRQTERKKKRKNADK